MYPQCEYRVCRIGFRNHVYDQSEAQERHPREDQSRGKKMVSESDSETWIHPIDPS